MEHLAQTETEPSACSVCGTDTESASIVALHEGPTLCLECYDRSLLSDFELVFDIEEH